MVPAPVIAPIIDDEDDGKVPSILDLIEAGMISPGEGNVSVHYKSVTYTADLKDDGSIQFQDKNFKSCGAFSLHVKRLQTPNKQSDDGWKATYVDGATLESYAKQYRQERGMVVETGPPRGRPGRKRREEQEAAERAAAAAAAAAAAQPVVEDKWVQCSRCEQWRVVPDEHWAEIENDPREDWFCEDARWNVTTTQPFTPACPRK